jgi:hypothetical protein
MKKPIALFLILSFTMAGCYNSYSVPPMEFRKLQSPEAVSTDTQLADKLDEGELAKLLNRAPNGAVTVKTGDSKAVAVTRQTRLYAESNGGRRYRVTPFNFKMRGQLVAPDRDTLLQVSELKDFEIDVFSTGKTIGLVAAGVAVAAGFIAVILVTADEGG